MHCYQYPRPAITVDAIVYCHYNDEVYILLIQRNNNPFKDAWALPGGFAEMDELLETACIRELEEETGLKVAKMHQFKTYDAINRDPRGRTISTIFYTQIKNLAPVRGNDDAKNAKWFPMNHLPKLAFDHQQIISDFNYWIDIC